MASPLVEGLFKNAGERAPDPPMVYRHHAAYVGALAGIVGRPGPLTREMAETTARQLRQRPAFQRIQRRKADGDARNEVMMCLVSSWQNLWSLARAGEDRASDNARLHSAAATVNAYYAVYMASACWLIGKGFRIDGHLKFLRSISTELVRRDLLLPPFNVSCAGVHQIDADTFTNSPDDGSWDLKVPGTSLREEHRWPMVRKLLATTRRAVLEDRFAEHRQRRKKTRLTRQEKIEIASSVHSSTAFDYLFRLRVRSNYKDIRAFLMGGDVGSHLDFVDDLRCVAESLCLQSTIVCAQLLGSDIFDEALGQFHPGALKLDFIDAQLSAVHSS